MNICQLDVIWDRKCWGTMTEIACFSSLAWTEQSTALFKDCSLCKIKNLKSITTQHSFIRGLHYIKNYFELLLCIKYLSNVIVK